MGYREVRVYEGEFPTLDQIICGDPTAPPFPKEIWREQMQPGEFAVRFRDGKTGLPTECDGKIFGQRSEATCRVYDSLAEANWYATQSTQDRVGVNCRIIDHQETIITAICDQKKAVKFSAVSFGGTFVWIAGMTLCGMAIVWLILRAIFKIASPFTQDSPAFGWLGWTGMAVSGFALSLLGGFAAAWFRARQRWKRVHAEISPEEWTKYEQLNRLFGSADPQERERFLALRKEFEARLREIHKK